MLQSQTIYSLCLEKAVKRLNLKSNQQFYSNYFYFNEHMYTPTSASILSFQYLLFYRAQMKFINPLRHRNICQCNKRTILNNLLLLYFPVNLFHQNLLLTNTQIYNLNSQFLILINFVEVLVFLLISKSYIRYFFI